MKPTSMKPAEMKAISRTPARGTPRFALHPPHTGVHRIDGAWWPRSRDLTDELPPLLAALEDRWGRITRVTVDSGMWLASSRRMTFGDRVVHLNWSAGMGHRDTVCLLSLGVGRCDLTVVPPEATAAEAHRALTAASRPEPATVREERAPSHSAG
ncbi:DUF5994 family protein [Streptomyces iconiensis]|uniref:DUF5994 family protein n=1 Tax=Streptomyces iconiensis TaxID=1384038 RepID=A0ABT7A1E3_9ACTN|nr:DUF5994 family protein [Streptomyces iconiensis]MDJ1134892.1 DUF5994 family protein [Streptomyces iconiensis]